MAATIPDIVDDLYKKNNYEITDDALMEEILKHKELSIRDLWLLPQYPFNEWRKKYDYPGILDNLKKNQSRFSEWMELYNLTDEMLMDGYISSFLNYKYKEEEKKKKGKLKPAEKKRLAVQQSYSEKGDFHLIKVNYKGKTSHQVWNSYDGITQSAGDGEPVLYEYVLSFVSYSDWCIANNLENEILDRMDKVNQNTQEELVYLNGNIRLLKMGGIAPPVNSVGMLYRGKNLDFVNVSGLILKDTIHFSDLGNLQFNYCTVDNLSCSELDMPHLAFQNCSVRNMQINNSELQNWKFINSYTSGKISNSLLQYFRVWGGFFNPVFENSEPDHFGIWHKPMKHSPDFDRTYRALYKANSDIGNYKEATKFKLMELDFIGEKQKGWQHVKWWIDKNYWGYGYVPQRIILFTLLAMLFFGVIYSFAPSLIINNEIATMSLAEKIGNSLYGSICTFVTLGYSGNIAPQGFFKVIASIEAILGAITMGFLVVSLTKTKE